MILLLLATAAADPDVLMSNARTRLAAPCAGPACAAPSPHARYRIDGEATAAISAKDRAYRDDGSKCNVVGARRCPKRGRTIFRTDFAD